MKSATALTLLAFGAVFAFAVNAHPRFFNFQVLGWVLMLTAIAGLVIPRRGRSWRRRTILVKDAPEQGEASGAGESDTPTETADSEQTQGHVQRESIVEFTKRSSAGRRPT